MVRARLSCEILEKLGGHRKTWSYDSLICRALRTQLRGRVGLRPDRCHAPLVPDDLAPLGLSL